LAAIPAHEEWGKKKAAGIAKRNGFSSEQEHHDRKAGGLKANN
jgi:hypothetical protein